MFIEFGINTPTAPSEHDLAVIKRTQFGLTMWIGQYLTIRLSAIIFTIENTIFNSISASAECTVIQGATERQLTILKPTQLGLAALNSCLSPDEALYVFRDLQKARRHLVLESELHLIYLATPVHHLFDSWSGSAFSAWHNFYNLYNRLPPCYRAVGTVVGVSWLWAFSDFL